MALHFETRIYTAVVELAKVVLPVIRNMQWQTVAEAKEKDKTEVAQCRRKK